MKRLFSLFLSLMILLCCVVPVSATSFDSFQVGNVIDVTPYINNPYIDTSSMDSGDYINFDIDFPETIYAPYFYMIVRTDDDDPSFRTHTSTGGIKIKPIEGDLYAVYGSANSHRRDFLYLRYYKGTGTFFEILSLEISQADFLTGDIDFTYRITGSYSYRSYNAAGSNPQYTTVSASLDKTYNLTINDTLDTPLIHKNETNGHFGSSYEVNEANIFTTTYLTFDWTEFDRVDILFWNGFDEIQDCVFYVDGINVLKSIYPYELSPHTYSIVTLDFSDLDPNLCSRYCTGVFRGYEEMSSSTSHSFFFIRYATGFSRTVSDNFWPYWLSKILVKFDNLFSSLEDIFDRLGDVLTGRSSDQSAADSFNDSIDDQSDELEDLSSDLNSVTRPPLSDVNLSTSGMVNSNTIVLATTGISSIMSNSIILRVLIMALTFALAGFILFGKR